MAGHSRIRITENGLQIEKDGDGVKFVDSVQQITFSAEYAKKTGQEVCYITERAVFLLTKEGLYMTEIAPGVDLERDILSKMDFRPQISDHLQLMDRRLFREGKMMLHCGQKSSAVSVI